MRDTPQPEPGPLSQWSNQELVKLVQQCQSNAAWAELDRRFRPWRIGRIHRLARKYGLPDRELADAQVDAVAAQFEAFRKFDPTHSKAGDDCQLSSYLNLVVTKRFLDFFWK